MGRAKHWMRCSTFLTACENVMIYTIYCTCVAFGSMNNAHGDVRIHCTHTDWDRLRNDRRRQTDFTLLGEPLQSWHHNVSCLCQRKEGDKWLYATALMLVIYGVIVVLFNVITTALRCWLLFFSRDEWACYHVGKSYKPCRDEESNVPGPELINPKFHTSVCLRCTCVYGDRRQLRTNLKI